MDAGSRDDPPDDHAGSLLLRVWFEGSGPERRLVGRLLEWNTRGGRTVTGPGYATGADSIVREVRRWLAELEAP
jgi:hypothetical protein